MTIIKTIFHLYAYGLFMAIYILGTIWPIRYLSEHHLIIFSLTHLSGTIAIIALWAKKICPDHFNSTKAPMFITISVWYAYSFVYLFEPEIFSDVFYPLIAASIIFIWAWDEIKNELDHPFCL